MSKASVRIHGMNKSPETADVCRLLRTMYNTWRGPLTHEAGIHRFIRMSPHHGGLRCTTFVAVTRRRHRRPPDRIVRAYILAPYTLVKDYIVGTETEDVAAVLAGDLSTFYPEEPHA